MKSMNVRGVRAIANAESTKRRRGGKGVCGEEVLNYVCFILTIFFQHIFPFVQSLHNFFFV